MADNSVYFNFDNDEESNPREAERLLSDVLSDSGFEDISSTSHGGRHYAKKKTGLLAWGEKVGLWWHQQNIWIKLLLTFGIVLAALAAVWVVWKFVPCSGRWKLMAGSILLLAAAWAFYIIIPWRHRKTQRVLTIIVSVLLALLLIISTVAWNWFHSLIYNYDNDFPADELDLGSQGQIDKNIINIALFGIDTRDTDSFKGNSDSIMILSLNTAENTVKIVSVMRDSLVPIERDTGKTYYKINAAYSWGGAELAVKTLNTVFDLDITEYATVNFFGMAKIIDAVGGIDAELTENEVNARGDGAHGINDMIAEVCGLMGLKPADYYVKSSGVQHLNGVQAVAYSRIRYVANIWGTNNDYGRTERQRYVMEQLFDKAITMKKSEYPKLVKELIPYTVTSLSIDEILNLAFDVLLESPTFGQGRLPVDKSQMTSPSGSFGSVVYYDLDYATDLIHAFFYDDITFEDYVAAHGIQYNNWYAKRNSSGSSSSGGSTTQGGITSRSESGTGVSESTESYTTSETTTSISEPESSVAQKTESKTAEKSETESKSTESKSAEKGKDAEEKDTKSTSTSSAAESADDSKSESTADKDESKSESTSSTDESKTESQTESHDSTADSSETGDPT